MREWIFRHWEHVLCGLLLFSRLADVGTTWLVSPQLRLEANPIVRKLRWPFALATLGVCVIPYYSTPAAYALTIASLLVSASNARSIWLARALGEERYYELMRSAAARSSPRAAVAWTLLGPALIALVGALFWLLAKEEDWARWGALGIWTYAFAYGLHGSRFVLRLVRESRAPRARAQ